MIGSSRSCSSRMRPSKAPISTPTSEPVMKLTRTRIILIETSAKISPLPSIGIAVRNTLSGGGMRNGLKKTVDSSCQMQNAISRDAVESSTVRYGTKDIEDRSGRNGNCVDGSAIVVLPSRAVTMAAGSWLTAGRSMRRLHPLVGQRLVWRLEQPFYFIE